MTRSNLAIEASGLVKVFGDVRAVDGVDLAVRRGSVYGVLGPNGAGKTTTIRMLATLLEPDAGSAHVLGHDVQHDADAVRGLVSLTGQMASVDEDLTGRENLVLLGWLLGLKRPAAKARADRAAGRVRARGRREPARQALLGRHAPAAGHRRQHRRDPRAAVPRRADDRPRPALAQPGVGHHPRPARGGNDHSPVHAVPRRGRPARGRDRGHRPRPRDRRGHARAAEGVGRLGRAARAPDRPRAAPRGGADPRRASSAASSSRPTRPRSPPSARTPTAAPWPSPRSRRPASRWPASRSASRASTRSSWP